MRIEIPQHKKRVHSLQIAVRWGDMDAMGHVNNSVYFRYMETARIEWMCAIGCQPAPQAQGPVIVNAFCNFYQQLAHPDQLLLTTYVSDPGRCTFESWCTIARQDQPEVICAAGGATVIWIDAALGKACALPDWMRAQVE